MISALLYLRYHSFRNRMVARLKRLRQPKYLLGAIVGGLYFYFYFFRWILFPRGRGGPATVTATPTDGMLSESIAALILLTIVLLAWLIPRKRAALAFTEAEIAFLFPAPIARRTLIHFKLLRSQMAILFTTLLLTLISNRVGGGGRALIYAAGWWVALSTLNLHFLGASFARTMLLDRGISNWKRRVIVIVPVVLAFGVVGVWAVRALPPLTSDDLANLTAIQDYARQVLVSGPLPYLLIPFRLVVRPYLATDAIGFLQVIWPSVLLMMAHYWWVIRSDVAFEEASLEASQKLAEKVAAVRSGNWQSANEKRKAKRPPFVLRPVGWPAVALLWKNLIGAGQAFTLRLWIIIAVSVVAMLVAMRGVGGDSNWLGLVGILAATFGGWALLIGPQIVRQDLRQDLPNADVLKTFPMRGWQVALGEILAPAVILTGVQWLLVIVAVVCLAQADHEGLPGGLVVMIGLSAALVLPLLNVILLLIPNAAVLLFPAWFQLGRDGTQGIEATGQRLIFALGQLLAFVVALIPAVAVSAAVFFLVNFATGVFLAVPVATIASVVVLTIEAGLGVMLLGRLFERFDLSVEQTA